MKTKTGWYPLHIAIYHQKIDVINFLLEEDILKTINDDVNGYTFLIFACSFGYEDVVKILINVKGIDIDTNSSNNTNAIKSACMNNNWNIVNILINLKKSNEEKINYINKNILLHIAAEKNYLKMLINLMKYKPDLNYKTRIGWSALHYAAKNNNFEIFRELIKGGAFINDFDNQWNTPLHIACEEKQIKFIHHVLNTYHGNLININSSNINGDTPLHIVCESGIYEISRLLLENGARADVLNKNHETPLHIACKYNNKITINLLLEKYPDIINKRSISGKTALYCAVEMNNCSVVSCLLNYNPDINIENNNKISPLQIAYENNIAILLKY